MFGYENNSSADFATDECTLWRLDNDKIIVDFRYLIYGPTLCFVIVFGILGNILTFCIFQKRPYGRKGRHQQQRVRLHVPKMHKYLAILSIWDSMLIIGSFFLYNLPYLMYGRVRMYGSYVRVYPYAYAVACASRTGGIWILIASAIDRYFAVCHPFAHHVYSTTRRTNLVITACCALSFIYGWPRYYHIELQDCFDENYEEWTLVAIGSDIRSNPVYWYAYKIAADFVLVSVGPFVILSCLSLAVGLAVRKSTRSRRAQQKMNLERAESSTNRARKLSANPTATEEELPSSRMENGLTSIRRHEKSQRRRSYQETQHSLNFLLVTVLSKFLVCHSLPAVLDVCETIMDPMKFQSPFMDDMVHAANALVVVNSSANIILYLACSRRFRLGVTKTLFEGLKKQHSRESALRLSTPKENGSVAVSQINGKT